MDIVKTKLKRKLFKKIIIQNKQIEAFSVFSFLSKQRIDEDGFFKNPLKKHILHFLGDDKVKILLTRQTLTALHPNHE